MSNRKVSAYLTHAIRGSKGPGATMEEIRANCMAALELAKFIREHIPEIDLYVPAEHEDFVFRAYTCGYVTEEQILDVDCQILEAKDLLIIFTRTGERIVGGVATELDRGNEMKKVVVYIDEADTLTNKIVKLVPVIERILKQSKKEE